MRLRPASLTFLILLCPPIVRSVSLNTPSEIPQHGEAVAAAQNFTGPSSVTVTVTSRRPENPASSEDLARLRDRVLKALARTRFTPSEQTSGGFGLELIVEPSVRYGLFHYQNAPYVYLTLRDAATRRLLYCSYQRARHFTSATERLLHDLDRNVQHTAASPHGSLAACAEQAMRPL